MKMKGLIFVFLFLGLFIFTTSAFASDPCQSILNDLSTPRSIGGTTYSDVVSWQVGVDPNNHITLFYNYDSGLHPHVLKVNPYGQLGHAGNAFYRYTSWGTNTCYEDSGTGSYWSWGYFYNNYPPLDTQDIHSTQPIYNINDSGVDVEANLGMPPQLTITNDSQVGTVAISPTGSGASSTTYTVQDSTYDFNDQVTLTAAPATGQAFAYWDDGQTCNTTNPITVTMDKSMEMTAVFRPVSFSLSFPLHNSCGGQQCTPYTEPVSTVFDHSVTGEYGSDTNHHVTAFNGEVSANQNPYSGSSCYPKADNSAFLGGINFNYEGTTSTGNNYYLCYDGHPGYDYKVPLDTALYADADGIAHIPTNFPGTPNAQMYKTVEIDHQNGYKTYYLHLHTQNVTDGQQVYKGQTIIGYSGNTGTSGYHLHLEVQEKVGTSWVPVDPYGWTGSGSDPYTQTVNINMWE